MFRNHAALLGSMLFVVLLTSRSLRAQALFQAARSYASGGANALSIAVGDLNGDGKPDLAVANGCSLCTTNGVFGVGVLLGNGDGTFQSARNYVLTGLGPFSVAVADVNGDGKPDLIAATSCFSSSNCDNGGVWVLLGNGDGTFQSGVTYLSGGVGADGVAVTDVNGDGNADLLVANGVDSRTNLGSVGVLLGNGDGTFQAARTYGSGGMSAWLLGVGDVNLDGKIDVVTLNCGPVCGGAEDQSIVGILLGNGDGTFQPATINNSGGSAGGSISLADVNLDGKPDVVVATGSTAAVLLGQGDGTFQSAQTYDSRGTFPDAAVVADVNRDGKPDLLVANEICGDNTHCAHGSVGVLLGNGDGTFQAAQRFNSGGYGARGLAVADVNGDSKPDLIVANTSGVGLSGGGVIGVLFGASKLATTTMLRSNRNNTLFGQPITFTAQVSSTGQVAHTGSVTFQNGGAWIGAATLSDGIATLTKPHLPAGALSITAIYSGDTESLKSVSAPLVQTIRRATTRTILTSSFNPSLLGQAVTFTARVTSSTAQIAGTVVFTAGTTTLGSVNVTAGGTGHLTTRMLTGGNTEITGTYTGNANINKSSASLTQIVN